MTRRTRLGVAAAVAALTLLGGCGDETLPRPDPREPADAVPVVTDAQVAQIRESVTTALSSADSAVDPAALQPRLGGPALQLRTVDYAIRQALPGSGGFRSLGGEMLADITPAADGWPRFFLTVTQPAPEAVPLLQLLVQPGPREPYHLHAYVTLLPGVTLPEMPTDEPPQALPPAEPSGLVLSPANVVARYADLLTRGADSAYADNFAEDPLRAQILQEQAAERSAVGEFFDYTVAHTPRQDAVWAVRTEDGGALVLGVIDAVRTFRVTAPGARLPLPADLAALAGRGEAGQAATVTSVEVVAFAVPPEGSPDPITVLGGERGVLDATAS